MSIFGNRAGTNTPPRSDFMPDLSMSGLNARLLNLRRTPPATDLNRTNPTSAARTPSTATLVDVIPDSPSVLPSGSGGLFSRTASQDMASLTGTLPAAPSAALTRARNDLYCHILTVIILTCQCQSSIPSIGQGQQVLRQRVLRHQ